jgi:hypothetical protein
MDAEMTRLRALVRLKKKLDRGPRYLLDETRRAMIAEALEGHLLEGETFKALKATGVGVVLEIDSVALHGDLRGDEWGRLDTILAALASVENVSGGGVIKFEAIVILRPLTEAVATGYFDAFGALWRGMLAERISGDAWTTAMGRLKRLRDAVQRWPVDDIRVLTGIDRIVAHAVASPPPPRPLLEPGPNDVTLPEILIAYRAAAAGEEPIRLVSGKAWRDLFHEEGEIRIGRLRLRLFKRDNGARGTVHARHDDGRVSDFERLHAMGPDPLHVMDEDEFEKLCGLLEALEPVAQQGLGDRGDEPLQ